MGATMLVVFVGGAYYTRNRWLPLVTPRSETVAHLPWAPLTADGAARARSAIARLDRVDGPVFTNLSAADLASFILDSAGVGLPSGSRVVEATLRGDQILLRMQIRVGDLGADNVPLLGGVSERTATVVIGGALAVGDPGIGIWRVSAIDVDAVSVPGWAVARVARAVGRYLRVEQAEPGAFQFGLPWAVADVRVGTDAVTLYKAVT